MTTEEKQVYYRQFLDYTIVDYKIVQGFPVLILAKDDKMTYEVTVSKNDQRTEAGVLVGFPRPSIWGESYG